MNIKDKIMLQPETTRRKIALGATVVVCLFIFTLWLGQTSKTIAVAVSEAARNERTIEPNSPFRVIRNLGSALMGIFRTEPISSSVEDSKL